jgi:hypothetical protein
VSSRRTTRTTQLATGAGLDQRPPLDPVTSLRSAAGIARAHRVLVRALAATGVALIVLGPGFELANAQAREQPFAVINEAQIGPRQLVRAERAIRRESLMLRRYWHTPVARFGADGWSLYLTPSQPQTLEGKACGCLGFHDVTPSGVPYAVVYAALRAGTLRWTVVASHEVMEALADPELDRVVDGQLAEICDPMADYPPIWLAGVPVTDFVTPAWFRWHADPDRAPRGTRWDGAGRLLWTPGVGWLYRP